MVFSLLWRAGTHVNFQLERICQREEDVWLKSRCPLHRVDYGTVTVPSPKYS